MEGAESRGGDQGITQRGIRELFQRIDEVRAQANNTRHINVFVSYLQIYNEKVFDLLNPQANLSLQKQRTSAGTSLDP